MAWEETETEPEGKKRLYLTDRKNGIGRGRERIRKREEREGKTEKIREEGEQYKREEREMVM